VSKIKLTGSQHMSYICTHLHSGGSGVFHGGIWGHNESWNIGASGACMTQVGEAARPGLNLRTYSVEHARLSR
jgi:hypothetical protein